MTLRKTRVLMKGQKNRTEQNIGTQSIPPSCNLVLFTRDTVLGLMSRHSYPFKDLHFVIIKHQEIFTNCALLKAYTNEKLDVTVI